MKLLKVMLSALCIVALCAGCPKKTETEDADGGTDTPTEEPTDKDGDDATTE